ncbi:unnamed protein product, partial [Closterium sp. Naga37s-1]
DTAGRVAAVVSQDLSVIHPKGCHGKNSTSHTRLCRPCCFSRCASECGNHPFHWAATRTTAHRNSPWQ